ncbi:hypothetical protein [Geobacter benzoatilyticus]|jgi:hypothetical protein|uniref:Uncharacterized protein n=1 Tax=Geobacter benzoatilyticus TaxID=2815309 RepID=A0ABX7Q463_9BACT|nr:hypothetical protein [Geobacter benzoatilyticus]QSV46239.1 hypothetical protein JZM60_02880 [Geobacter benzoatilyticus]
MPEKAEVKIKLSSLPTMHTDGVNIACRLDGGILLQLISESPDGYYENVRTVFTKDSAIEFLENLATALDHFPVKQAPKASKAKKVSKPKA